MLVHRPACLRLDHKRNSATRRMPLHLVHEDTRSTPVPRLVVVPQHRHVPRKAQLPRCGALIVMWLFENQQRYRTFLIFLIKIEFTLQLRVPFPGKT